MSIVDQRNRFLSFAFAAADILIETGLDGEVKYCAGATAGLGEPRPDTVGDSLAERLDPTSRPIIRALTRGLKPGRRAGPVRVTIGKREARLSGWRLDDAPLIRWTIVYDAVDAPPELEPEVFQKHAEEALRAARDDGAQLLMTVMKLEGCEDLRAEIGEKRAARIAVSLDAIVSEAVGGGVAKRVRGDRYALIHDEAAELDQLRDNVLDLLNAYDIRPVDVTFSSIDDAPDLDSHIAVEAFLYAVNSAADGPNALDIGSLQQAAKALAAETQRKMHELRTTIAGRVIEPYAQPIHNLTTGEILHYEVFARLPDGRPIGDAVGFAERTGLIHELDYAMAEIALSFLAADGDRPALAVNISGKSIANPAFGVKLMTLLAEAKIDRSRLVFELTETAAVSDPQTANAMLQKIRKRGHKVCLDDFGAGAAGFHYLRDFDVDLIKIDGRYIRSADRRDRDGIILRSIIRLADDMGCESIAEMVETDDQANALQALGATYGQGYLFGKPQPLKTIAPARGVRRSA